MSSLKYKVQVILEQRDILRTRFFFPWVINNRIRRGKQAAQRLKGKAVVDVAFIVPIPGMWKADYLFRAMQDHPRFHPYIVVIPYSRFKGFSEEEIANTLHHTEEFFKQKGYEYVVPQDMQNGRWQDIRKTLNPDIVFFSTPYRDIPRQYYVHRFKDRLTCYIPYGFVSMTLFELNYNQILSNLVNMYFVESPLHLEFARQYSRSHGRNFVVSGYPCTEVYLHSDYHSPDVWKPQSHPKKRIIWAPHHTIDATEGTNWATFLAYSDIMLQIAEKYKDSLQFAFKPHQLLRFKLEKLWGRERTDAYYQQWASMENTQLEEAGYVDLFIHSDAMIHDSGGFTTEYMFVKKPVMYLMGKQDPKAFFNTFGMKAFDLHHQGHCQDDIEQFLQQVVLQGHDDKAQDRTRFFDTYLAPQDGKMPSQRIIKIIEQAIDGENVFERQE